MREMKRAIDMTRVKVLTVILSFAIPVFIGNIFQQFYIVVDTVVIGNVLGDDALAAIGASTALFSLTVGITNDNLVRYCTDCCDWFLQCI